VHDIEQAAPAERNSVGKALIPRQLQSEDRSQSRIRFASEINVERSLA
jgi:hypothetical protein